MYLASVVNHSIKTYIIMYTFISKFLKFIIIYDLNVSPKRRMLEKLILSAKVLCKGRGGSLG